MINTPNINIRENAIKQFFELITAHHASLGDLISRYYIQNCKNDNVSKLSHILSILNNTQGKIVLVGCGKTFKICNKVSSMLNSLNIQSITLHPSEAMHGDLGSIKFGTDLLIFVSSSGETIEIIQLMDFCNNTLQITNDLIIITNNCESTMAMHSLLDCVDSNRAVLEIPQLIEESNIQHGLKAPTISTTLLLIVLDCLVYSLSYLKYNGDIDYRNSVFNKFHPGGGIGLKNSAVDLSLFASSSVASDGNAILGVDRDDLATEYFTINSNITELLFLQSVVKYDWCKYNDKTYPSVTLQRAYKQYSSHNDGPTMIFDVSKLFEQFISQ
ncbi:conserved putative sugar isomerase [Saccharomycodes ludwigii]|uniref:conserved putative sugar isomerase n=1 Tax=Saccharomycodes ludwigii TaxID=36035 RepID=UPI001E86CC1F|nr:conserved putative sugar isomerase [Saccharomycodes ludwigii]KAH3900904.1 conserved putative sugar isomerase [Saccharomycodes ludwigii]